MINKEQAYELIDFIVRETKGLEALVTIKAEAQDLSRFANSQIHQNVADETNVVNVHLFGETKQIDVSTNCTNKEELRRRIEDAMKKLSALPKQEFSPTLVADPMEISADCFKDELAMQYGTLERAAAIKEAISQIPTTYNAYGALFHQEYRIILGNSAGIKRFVRGNYVQFSALVGSDVGGTGYAKTMSNEAKDIDVSGILETAYKKARINHDAIELEPGKYTVILEPLAVGDLLAFTSFMGLSGESVMARTSFLTDKIGKQIFSSKISITDDYTNRNTLYLPFDLEGTPRQKVDIISNGVARGLIYDTRSAARAKVRSTGHAYRNSHYGLIPQNLVMGNGDKSMEEIIASTENGLLVTRFHYVNPLDRREAVLTALTKDGLFVVKDGKVVGAAKNMRFTESMLNAFHNVEEVSRERQKVTGFYFGSQYVPGLKINNFTFTGKTDA